MNMDNMTWFEWYLKISGWIALIIFGIIINHYFLVVKPNEINFEKEQQTIVELQKQIELLLTVQHIALCESSGRHNEVWGDAKHKYPAYGIGQFQERTFYWLAGRAGFKNLNWKKVDDQLKVLIWAVDNGYGNLWSCYRKVK